MIELLVVVSRRSGGVRAGDVGSIVRVLGDLGTGHVWNRYKGEHLLRYSVEVREAQEGKRCIYESCPLVDASLP